MSFLLAFYWFSATLTAQERDIRFERISIEQGLSQATVNEILQDRKGFLWVGTQDGLNRYDGYRFKVYQNDPQDTQSLSGNYIGPVYEDRQNTLWIGVADTLHRYDREGDFFNRFRQETLESEASDKHEINAIFEDHQGHLWIGTSGIGLKQFDRASSRFLTHREDPAIPNHPGLAQIHSICEDRLGQLWVGTWSHGLLRIDRHRQAVTQFLIGSDATTDSSVPPIVAIFQDPTGYLWLGTMGAGIFRLDPRLQDPTAEKNLQHYLGAPHIPNSLADSGVTALIGDDEGGIWVGTTDYGLFRLDPSTGIFANFRANPNQTNSLSANYVNVLFQDRTGLFWAGTSGGGLNKFHPDGAIFRHYHHQAGNLFSLSSNAVRAIHEDRQGTLWVGTRHGGLNAMMRQSNGRFENRFSHFRHDPDNPHSLNSDRIRSLFEDRAGNLWIGTGDNGLNRLDPSRKFFTHFIHDPNDAKSLGGNHVLTIYEDKEGTLWIGLLLGLNRFDPETGQFHRYHQDPKDPKNHNFIGVNALLEDSYGDFWIGTNGGGLDKMDRTNETFTHYRNQPDDCASLSNDLVMSLYEDTEGTLWVGTLGGGLNRFDRSSESFQSFRKKHGLPNDVVYGILADESGFLWLSTHKGLSRFDPESQTFKNFDMGDGLQSNEFDFGAFAKGRNNRLYFGGINGFNSFIPSQVISDPHAPSVILTDFQVNNQSVSIARAGHRHNVTADEEPSFILDKAIDETSELELSYKHRVISFEFAGLQFADPAKNQYAYMLEGFNKTWIHTPADKRVATYTNLDPGRYRFRVKASNKDGVWNENEAVLKLKLHPPPWQSPWALGLYALAGITLVAWLIRGQRRKLAYERAVVERLKRVDKLKDLFLANTSHELRTPLNGIIGLAQTLQDGATGPLPDVTHRHLGMIVASGKRLTHLIGDILVHSKLKTGHLTLQKNAVDLHSIADVVFTLSQSLMCQKNLALVKDLDPQVPFVYADEFRLQQIIFNLVGNAIKFTDEGQVRLSARVDRGRVLVKVSDTGIGIPEDQFEHIFESFGQGHSEPGSAYGGVGLGLAVSRQLVRLHDSNLEVTSTVGVGSTFSFSLPIFEESHQISPAFSPSSATTKVPVIPLPLQKLPWPTKDIHILVVDDEPINRQVLINHLSLEGYRISEAVDGKQALEMVETQVVDMVLLDIMMPRLSGYEVCRRLRQNHPLADLPVLLLTAKDQMDALAEGFAAGANDFLTKPLTKEELSSRVKMHLDLADIHRAVIRKVDEQTRALRDKHQEALSIQQQLAEQARQLELQTQRLKESDQLKTGFFTSISHELRTPLSLIIDPVRTMLEGLEEDPNNTQEPKLRIVLANAQRLLHLINQLLDLSQIEAGKVALKTKPQNMVATIRATIRRFSPWAERKSINLSFHTEIDPFFADFDADKLEKALDNLLSNAFKFTAEQGKIHLHLKKAEDGWVKLLVKDTGEGIAKAQLAHVFDRFFYIRAADSDRPASSGIGLTLARDLIRLHGGDIEVTSELGFGSEFTIVLPPGIAHRAPDGDHAGSGGNPSRDSADEDLSQAPEPGEAVLSGMLAADLQTHPNLTAPSPNASDQPTILIIEDHAEVRAYLSEQLASAYHVLEAANGHEGLRLSRETMPDLIVSDVMMPGMDGLALCKTLKSDIHSNHIPILLLTARAEFDAKLEGLALGADDFLEKPFHSKELQARIQSLLENRRRLRERFSEELILQPEGIPIHSADEVFLKKALKIIETQMAEMRFGVDDLADHLALSPRQLQRKVTAMTGMGPAAFIRSIRLKRAARLLENQTGTVAEISHAVGFKNPFYFSTLFRKTFGKSPVEYRLAEPIETN